MPLEYAALPRRGAAFLIDALVLTPAVLLARESAPLAVVAVTLWWTAFEASPWQASPGKRFLRMQTIQADGRPVGFGRALWRSALKALPWLLLPFWPWVSGALAVVTVLGMLAGRRRRAYADLLAGTAVIRLPGKD
ncbi:RDD family protein [bacterium]|nr:RDD family protein [bacterium]